MILILHSSSVNKDEIYEPSNEYHREQRKVGGRVLIRTTLSRLDGPRMLDPCRISISTSKQQSEESRKAATTLEMQHGIHGLCRYADYYRSSKSDLISVVSLDAEGIDPGETMRLLSRQELWCV